MDWSTSTQIAPSMTLNHRVDSPPTSPQPISTISLLRSVSAQATGSALLSIVVVEGDIEQPDAGGAVAELRDADTATEGPDTSASDETVNPFSHSSPHSASRSPQPSPPSTGVTNGLSRLKSSRLSEDSDEEMAPRSQLNEGRSRSLSAAPPVSPPDSRRTSVSPSQLASLALTLERDLSDKTAREKRRRRQSSDPRGIDHSQALSLADKSVDNEISKKARPTLVTYTSFSSFSLQPPPSPPTSPIPAQAVSWWKNL